MQLQKNTEHAFRCLAYLARTRESSPNEFLTKKDISEATGLTTYYIPRILIPLRDALLVEVKIGATGGFRLSLPPEDITLLDVINAMEQGTKLIQEPEESSKLSEVPGQDLWEKIQEVLDKKLESATVADLL